LYIYSVMRAKAICIFFLTLFYTLDSQTGPAGVGTSNTNVLWLKANAGTSSTVNATAISSWNDQSGNGINVSQATAAQQPSYATNVLNGLPGIQFDNNSGSTVADRMHATDNPSLDNTSGYSFFNVVKMNNIGTDARSVLSKRTSIDTDEAFMLFFFSSNYFYVDIDGIANRFNTGTAAYSNGTGYILDVFFDGSLAAANRSTVYEEEILRKTATETSTLVPDKASPLNIACTHSTDGRPFGGYISEIIIYTVAVVPAQRIIVNNYLSAKYNIALTSNDKYAGDNSGNGNYDYEVAGVGKEATGSNPSFSASTCGGLGISATGTGFDNTDYVLAGHASFTNTQIFTDVGGMTGANNSRWQRIWYFDITNTSTSIQTNIEFDMSDGGVAPVTLGPAADYVLLYRAGTTGNWTELTTGSAVVGDRVQFNGYTLANDGYYTIGSKDYILSPLPIELLDFNAIKNDKRVDINWKTASERQNDYFIVEKSKDGIVFETVSMVKGSSNSTRNLEYLETDFNPFNGISYYRLKQTDLNGKYTYSKIVSVNYHFTDSGMDVFPNPNNGDFNISLLGLENKEVLILIKDVSGKECCSKVILTQSDREIIAIDMAGVLAPGTYLIMASSVNKLYSKKIIVK